MVSVEMIFSEITFGSALMQHTRLPGKFISVLSAADAG